MSHTVFRAETLYEISKLLVKGLSDFLLQKHFTYFLATFKVTT